MSAEPAKSLAAPFRPGQRLREQMRHVGWRTLLAVFATVLLTAALGIAIGLHAPLFVAAEIVAIGVLFVLYRWELPRIDRLDLGAKGEEDVGAILDGLVDDGWLPIHGANLGRGDVDHILVGPAGIFTIETKGHRGSVHVDKIDPHYLKQAYAESKLIERIAGLKVEPLLVYSRAYLIGHVPRRRQGVLILPARMLAGYLRRRSVKIRTERVVGLHRQLLVALAARTQARFAHQVPPEGYAVTWHRYQG
jgi:hypothetical protein